MAQIIQLEAKASNLPTCLPVASCLAGWPGSDEILALVAWRCKKHGHTNFLVIFVYDARSENQILELDGKLSG